MNEDDLEQIRQIVSHEVREALADLLRAIGDELKKVKEASEKGAKQ